MLPLLYSRNSRATRLPHSTQTKDGAVIPVVSARLALPWVDTVSILPTAILMLPYSASRTQVHVLRATRYEVHPRLPMLIGLIIPPQ